MPQEVFQVANNAVVWFLCFIVVAVALIQSLLYIRLSLKAADAIGFERRNVYKGLWTGAVSSVGPSFAVFLVMVGLISAVGAPIAWLRCSIIGSAPIEMTGAMLGAAAVAQILSIDCQSTSDRSLLRAMTLAILLLILCYGLRQLSLVPVLGYCGIAFLLRFCSFFGFGKQTKRSARPMLVAAGLALLILGGLFAGRALEIRLKQKQDALQWQQARSQVLDYINLKSLPSEALESVGWTDEQRILLVQFRNDHHRRSRH